MIKSSIEKISESIGFDIGMSDNETQANLLNGFCRAIKNSMGEPNMGKQLCYIVDSLNKDSIDVLRELVEFCDLKES